MDEAQIEHNINLAKLYVIVLNTKNLELLDEIFHPHFQIRQQMETPSLRYDREKADINDIKNILAGYFTAFPNMVINPIDTIASINSAVVYWSGKMTHMGDFFGLKATNKKIEVEGFYYFKIQDKKIIDYNLTFDTLKLFSGIGHAIVAEGDENRIDEYFKILMNLELN